MSLTPLLVQIVCYGATLLFGIAAFRTIPSLISGPLTLLALRDNVLASVAQTLYATPFQAIVALLVFIAIRKILLKVQSAEVRNEV